MLEQILIIICANLTIHLCENEDNYDLLIVNKEQETATRNVDDPQVAEDEILENYSLHKK